MAYSVKFKKAHLLDFFFIRLSALMGEGPSTLLATDQERVINPLRVSVHGSEQLAPLQDIGKPVPRDSGC